MRAETRVIDCPFCHVHIVKEYNIDYGGWSLEKGSPPRRTDPTGEYWICPACSKRLDFERTAAGGKSLAFSLRR